MFRQPGGVRRLFGAVATAGVAVLAVATPAAAHVTVSPADAAKDSYTKFSFQVPAERPEPTVKLELFLPEDHPIAFVSVRPLPGWSAAVTKTKLAKPVESDDGTVTEAVTKITWTGGRIEDGQFQLFEVAMGPLPDTDQLVFKALQTYASGTVARWIQIPQEGQAEPDDPAPVVALTASSDSDEDAADTAATNAASAEETAAESSSDSSDGMARVLGGIGLVAGLAALAVAVLAVRRRPSAPAGD